MTKLYNRRKDTLKRQLLRARTTKAEKILWERIRQKQIKGIKFRRQYSIMGFVLDFYSPEIRLAIELDGGYHLKPDQIDYDKARQLLLESLEIKFLRFTNDAILSDISTVIYSIKKHCSPPYQGGDAESRLGGMRQRG